MAPRDAMAIEIGSRRIRALLAAREGGSLRVKRVVVEEVPEGIDAADPAALGRWIGQRLAAAGFPRGRATLALAREHVGLKRLSLPTLDANELPDMTRLALRRELPFDAEQAVIDYVPVERSETHTIVMAIAVPEDALRATRAVAEAADLRVERIGLRAMGSAALFASAADAGDDCVLAIDVTARGVEFCIVEKGAIRFSRAASFGREVEDAIATDAPSVADIVAEAVVTETRRTWMSYRIVEGATDVMRVVLMGDPEVADRAAPVIGEMLRADASRLDRHRLVATDGVVMDRVWPLAGMLLEAELGNETIDFARPHHAIDRGARLRRRALMAAGAAAVVLLAFWTLGRQHLSRLEHRLDGLRETQGELGPRAQRYQRDTYKLAHLRRWEQAEVRWLDHVLALQQIIPPPNEAVLDGWTGSIDFRGVRFDKKSSEWSVPMELAIVLEGEARNRLAADTLRESLVRSELYTASSSGADARGGKRLPYGFTYRLRTAEVAPPGGDVSAARADGSTP